jgi:hypothetical protein
MNRSGPSTPSRTGTRRLSGVVLGLICAAAIAGCGRAIPVDDVASLAGASGTTPPATSAASTDPEDALRQFAKCMREHGVDMPDPKPSQAGKGGGVFVAGGAGSEVDKSKMDSANKECQHFMDGAAQAAERQIDPAEEAKMKEQALAFAKCMREHGVDMPDPQFQSGGRVTQQLGSEDAPDTSKIDPSSPAFKDAQSACQTLMPNGGALNSDGPDGGGSSGGGPDGGGVGFGIVTGPAGSGQ